MSGIPGSTQTFHTPTLRLLHYFHHQNRRPAVSRPAFGQLHNLVTGDFHAP